MSFLSYELHARSGTKFVACVRDFDAPAEVFGNNEYAVAGLDWSAARFVLDIGAHIGCFALWLAERSQAHIFCIEPNPDAFERLSRNVGVMRSSGQVALRQSGLAGSPGRLHLILASNSASVRLGSAPGRGSDGGEVDVITLGHAIELSGFPSVDIVKMDIEGCEYSVLESLSPAVFGNISGWIIECHPTVSKDGSTAAGLLEAAGYEVVLETKPGGLALLIATRKSQALPLRRVN
jgi:FkbM family methyltransferase